MKDLLLLLAHLITTIARIVRPGGTIVADSLLTKQHLLVIVSRSTPPSQNTVFKIYDGQTQIILTAIINGLILLPFGLLFTPGLR